MGKSWRSVAGVLAVSFGLAHSGAEAGDWEWTIAPYFWASDIGLDVTANDEPVIEADVEFADIMDKTDLALMLHFEGRRGQVGFFVDGLFFSVSDEKTTSARRHLPGGTVIESSLDMGTYEVGGFYRFIDEGRSLDGLFGLRWLDTELTSDVTLPSPFVAQTSLDASDTKLDGFVGVRYGQPFGGRWDFAVRGDVATGGTEFTWNAMGTFGVRLGKTDTFNLRLGWRHMAIDAEVESDRGVDLENDITYSGPIGAVVFKL